MAQPNLPASRCCAMEGYLDKRQLIRSHRRFFRLDGATLSYSDSPETPTKGLINLRHATVVMFEDPARRITIRGKSLNSIKKSKEQYILLAPTPAEYVRWRGTIRRARASSAAAHISWSSSFSSLVEGFRGCVKEAVEASILDLSEYNEADYANLQQRHAEHQHQVHKLRAGRQRRQSQLDADDGDSNPAPPVVPMQVLDATDITPAVWPDEDPDDPFSLAPAPPPAAGPAGGTSTATAGSSTSSAVGHELAMRRAPHGRRTNPLPGTGAPPGDVDALGLRTPPPSSSSSRPLLQLPSVELDFETPVVPPRPGSKGLSLDARKVTATKFSGPAWHYLDVLNHAGGIITSVQHIAAEDQLQEFWDMYATTTPGFISEPEHRAILAHLVDEVKGTMPSMLSDIVRVVMRAYGLRDEDEQVETVLQTCAGTITRIAADFHAKLSDEVDALAGEMWSSLDEHRQGKVSKRAFTEFYRSRPIVPSSSLIDVTLDEIGSQIQRQLMKRSTVSTTAPSSVAGSNAPSASGTPRAAMPPPPRALPPPPSSSVLSGSSGPQHHLGDCGLDNLGNTCYMNCALQCLAHAPLLRQHLLLGKHHHGTTTGSGKSSASNAALCDSMADLFRVMCDGKTASANPAAVRKAINGRTKDFFAGITQHDAQELLMAVLDGLHEEMNTGKRGEYVELPDKPTRPDAELADEWWSAHQKSNQSPIVDWFHGQMKSTRTCRVCGTTSLCFDPFSVLSAPIPGKDGAATGGDADDVFHELEDVLGSRSDSDSRATSPRSSASSSSARSVSPSATTNDSFESVDAFGDNWVTVPAEDSPPRLVNRARRGKRQSTDDLLGPGLPPLGPGGTTTRAPPTGSKPTPAAQQPHVRHLNECLDGLFTTEQLDGVNEMYCSECKKMTPATRTTSLWRLPHYLTIGLKRFRHDRTGQVLSKNNARVNVPDHLDPTKWLDRNSQGGPYLSGAMPPSGSSASVPSPLYSGATGGGDGGRSSSSAASPTAAPAAAPAFGAPAVGPSAVPHTQGGGAYELFAVLRHSGWISGGHYTASCLSHGRWVMFNDSMVAPDRHEALQADDGVYVALYRLRRQPPTSAATLSATAPTGGARVAA